MKIVLFLHELALGGTTVNAIELATSLRDAHGHDVVVFASPGPMQALLHRSGLRFVPAPAVRGHPSLQRWRELREVVRSERPDLIHAWESWALVDAYFAVHLSTRLPILMTDMQMSVSRVLPRTVPSTFGTPQLVDRARSAGMRCVDLLLPPVDVVFNAPDAADPGMLRERCAIGHGEIVLVIVSRLIKALKGESLHLAIDAVGRLGKRMPLRLLIAGDGSARADLERQAQAVNAKLGRPAVILLGALLDPRPAYAAADVVIGMGGSALRGMAFGKPVIVVGEKGFAEALTPQTAPMFRYQGLFGLGRGAADAGRLGAAIEELALSKDRRVALGAYALEFARTDFALEVVAARLDGLCKAAAAAPSRRRSAISDGLRTAAIYVREQRFRWLTGPPEPVKLADSLPPALKP